MTATRTLAAVLGMTMALVACSDDEAADPPATTSENTAAPAETSADSADSSVTTAVTTADTADSANTTASNPPGSAAAGTSTTDISVAAGATTTTAATGAGATTTTVPVESGAPTTTIQGADTIALDAALQGALDQLPGWIADPSTIDAAVFTEAFLAAVTIDDVRAGLGSLGEGPWTIADVQPLSPTAATAVMSGPNSDLLVQVEVDAAGLVDTLFFENAGLLEPPTSLDDLVTQLTAGGELTGLLVADVEGGTCAATTEVNADQVLPIASTFKLYVLGAVATAIADGVLSWEQDVTIRPELRSPGAPLDVPDGSTLTVRDLAQVMIEVSDNSATDHLIDLVGRDAVEAMLTTFDHHDPAVTLPLLTTREMAIVKTDAELLARYAAADEAGRRALLTDEIAGVTPPEADPSWTEPRAVTEVEWFATPIDLCAALVGLQELSTDPGLEPIAEIMSTNPGIAYDPARFTTAWFKGGSEVGVLVGAWLVQRTDGTWFAVTGGAASTTATIDPAIIEIVGAAIALDGT